MVKHRFDAEIAGLREEAWTAYARTYGLDPDGDWATYDEARAAFVAGFNSATGETAARILRILEFEEGITEPMHHDARSGVSSRTVGIICDEFGLQQRKGRHA